MTQHFIVKIRAMKTQHKAARSSVGIESLQGSLHLRLPRKVNGGKQKYLTLGRADTPENRKSAELQSMSQSWRKPS
jgi:hypothetical protein